MSDYPWVIDSLAVVHRRYCSDVHGLGTPYGSLATTDVEMIEHLDRDDVSNNHAGTSPLVPCDHCILGKVPCDG